MITGDAGRTRPDAKVLAAAAIAAWLGLTVSVCFVYFVADDLWCIEKTMTRGIGWAFDPTAEGRLFYRPLTQYVYFKIMHEVFGLNALPFHLANMAIYLGCIFLVMKISRAITGNERAAAWAGLIYALAPINFLPIAFISGIQEVGLALLALGSVILFLGHDRKEESGGRSGGWLLAAASLLYGASLLAKESAIWIPVWLWIYDLAKGMSGGKRVSQIIRQRLWRHASFDAIMIIYLVLRFSLMPPPGGGDYEMSLMGSHVFRHFDEYMTDLFVSLGSPPLGRENHWYVYTLAALVSLIALVVAAVKKRSFPRPVFLGLVWFGLGMSMFLPITKRSYPYYIHLASIGVYWSVGLGLDNLLSRLGQKSARALALGYVVILFVAGGYNHRADMRDDFIMNAARATRQIHLGMKKRYPALEPWAKVILLTDIRTHGDPSYFGIKALYENPDLPVFVDRQAYDIRRAGKEYLFSPRPDFDFTGARVFAYTKRDGFVELPMGPDGSLTIRPRAGAP